MNLDFSEAEIQRYSRHILLPEVGAVGQAKLRDSSVLIIGAGGLGSPLALYLAAAGIGRLGIVDHDLLELSNLQRQVVHGTESVGMLKVESARARIESLNPNVRLDLIREKVTRDNVDDLVIGYDLVCDGCDNFDTRYAVADACRIQGKTLISAAVQRFDGQLTTFRSHKGGPCYRCLYPNAPADGVIPSCATAGVFGAVTGVMGTLQATEALKELLGIGESMDGRLLVWDGLAMNFHTLTLKRDPECPGCGHTGQGER